jgi:hypothetical protein
VTDAEQKAEIALEILATSARALVQGKQLAWMIIITAPENDATSAIATGGTIPRSHIDAIFTQILGALPAATQVQGGGGHDES